MTRFFVLLSAAASVSRVAGVLVSPLNLAILSPLKNADTTGQSCVTSDDIVEYCENDIDSDDSTEVKADCYCCEGSIFMGPIYSSCEAYISSNEPEYTDAISVVSIAQSFCNSVSARGFNCGGSEASTTPVGGSGSGGGSTPTPTAFSSSSPSSLVPTAIQTFGGGDDSSGRPPACTSFLNIYDECSSTVFNFGHLPNTAAASCLCYTNSKFNPKFDAYVSSCAKWVKTGEPTAYSDFVSITTFCEEFATASALSSSPSFTPSQTAKHTVGGATVTVHPTTSHHTNAAGHAAAGGSGLAAWLAVVLPMAML